VISAPNVVSIDDCTALFSFIHWCLFTQTPVYNVNRIMRNAGQKGRARHLSYNCPKIKTTLKYI